MGQIERVGSSTAPERRGAAAVARPGAEGQVGFAGDAVDYVEATYSPEESWNLLSSGMREWAEARAGQAIRDPHTATPTLYWYCRVSPAGAGGPRGSGVGASYDLVVFGKRGLVVSSGTTERLVDATDGTRWRHRRFDVPIDGSGVRHDHRAQAPANPAPAGGGRGGGPGGHPGGGAGLLPARMGPIFGNLPLATQRFLLEPFAGRGKRPVEAHVHATTEEVGREYRETFWTYVFDASWMGFAHAQRSVPLSSGLTGPALWNDSPEAAALRRAPWRIAAWVAPVQRPGRTVARP